MENAVSHPGITICKCVTKDIGHRSANGRISQLASWIHVYHDMHGHKSISYAVQMNAVLQGVKK